MCLFSSVRLSSAAIYLAAAPLLGSTLACSDRTAGNAAASDTGVATTTAGNPPKTFAEFVDRYLANFTRRHPSIAAGNGLHDADGTLEDFSPAAIAREIAELKTERQQLNGFAAASLTPDERVDQRILDGVIDGWLLEQETLENWKRNPMLYGSVLSDGVHNLMTQEYAPAPERMRRIIGKLRGVPALLQAARANVTNPPKLFAERALTQMRGASSMLTKDLPLAFAAEANTPLMDSLTVAVNTAVPLIDQYATSLERDVIPNASGSALIGEEAIARRYRSEELIDMPLADMLVLGERQLKTYQTAFRDAGLQISKSQAPIDTWMSIRKVHPKRGEVTTAAKAIVDSLTAFVREKDLATVSAGDEVTVEPAKPFDLGLASMHASPPMEKTPLKSIFYITDARADQSQAEQDAWLERFNFATLTNTAAHEAMPGHFLHSTYMRKTPGKVRRIWIGLNPFPQPSSGQDGWAHYAEQLVSEQGYANGDPRYKMAQLSDALTRVCRMLAGIKVHTGAWTLAQAQECFEKEAYVPTPAAKREAERSLYDPTYGGYFLGKMAMLTLRDDVKAKEGNEFTLKKFHERVMTNGIAPVWAHRQLLLPGDTGPLIRIAK